ncbi:MAG: hypothetical protein H0T51_03210 [Pirellulales bacterium]|nr:hypothetical protein [Pirellulales bacterium]
MRRRRLLNNSGPGRLAPGARLALCIAAIAAGWLLLLPWAARTPSVRGMIERNESLGIDPSAKFYSELPAMPAILDRVTEIRRRHGDAFELRNVDRR